MNHSAQLTFDTLCYHLDPTPELFPSPWRRTFDRVAQVALLYQLDLRADVPRITRAVRIQVVVSQSGLPATTDLIPSVFIGDQRQGGQYITNILGKRCLSTLTDLTLLLEKVGATNSISDNSRPVLYNAAASRQYPVTATEGCSVNGLPGTEPFQLSQTGDSIPSAMSENEEESETSIYKALDEQTLKLKRRKQRRSLRERKKMARAQAGENMVHTDGEGKPGTFYKCVKEPGFVVPEECVTLGDKYSPWCFMSNHHDNKVLLHAEVPDVWIDAASLQRLQLLCRTAELYLWSLFCQLVGGERGLRRLDSLWQHRIRQQFRLLLGSQLMPALEAHMEDMETQPGFPAYELDESVCSFLGSRFSSWRCAQTKLAEPAVGAHAS